MSNGRLGVVVKSLTTDELIFQYNPDKLFVPASNVKVLTSVTALSILKPDYRFKTVFYSGGDVTQGVIHGGLYIKGYGDPTLSTQHLETIAEEFKSLGVKEIKGGITVDDSYFDNIRYGKGWKEKWKGDVFSPPISALSLNYNTFYIKVYPSKPGRIPIVALEPKGTNVNVINKAITTNKGGRLTAVWLEGGKTIKLDGSISRRTPSYTLEITTRNPTLYAGSAFKRILDDAGIRVEGYVTVGVVPDWAGVLYTHFSDPLYLIIAEFNKNSVNIIGENIIKTLGATIIGEPGTWEKGTQVVSNFLHEIGIKDSFEIFDGSGLSLLNRVSPNAITDVLEYAYNNQVISLKFLNSLSIGGVDGTLKKRFRRSEVEGRVMAKTGHLSNVNALSGYLFTKSGDVLVFSILANGLGSKATSFQNSLLGELVDCCGRDNIRDSSL
ncbi:MAG: D-alanyl-D-alanine carboxypeptidase/D-alanyl-D-alanine-endopeptidase [Candidatus Dadabacteria bacterium RBG_19FT_COMBO_40_33]|nr:MAG: D-alanyl-D-alanine carboxypeptidase/D-alanyl-D-alanine-endopeptidase [Candidatus Dadabacteria bacterium RBG_19FT_COMBO_40_33]